MADRLPPIPEDDYRTYQADEFGKTVQERANQQGAADEFGVYVATRADAAEVEQQADFAGYVERRAAEAAAPQDLESYVAAKADQAAQPAPAQNQAGFVQVGEGSQADPLDRAFGDLGPEVVANMKAIRQRESNGRADAHKNDEIEDSRGPLQVNARAHPHLAEKYDLFDPEQNALAAREVYDSQGYRAWFNAAKAEGLLDGQSTTRRGLPTTDRVPGPADGLPGVQDGAAGARGGTRDIAPNQLTDKELTPQEALAACGPAAAVAFARANGRNPTLREAVDLAKNFGWTEAGGMNGFENQVALLHEMKKQGLVGDFEAAPAPDWNRVAQDAETGNPVTISTGLHYFIVSDYDKQTGRYYVGDTGRVVRGGSDWLTAEQMEKLSTDRGLGGINGVIYADNPASPIPSVAAEQSWGGSVIENLPADPSRPPVLEEMDPENQNQQPDPPSFSPFPTFAQSAFGPRLTVPPPFQRPKGEAPDYEAAETMAETGAPIRSGEDVIGSGARKATEALSQPLDTSSAGAFIRSLAPAVLTLLGGVVENGKLGSFVGNQGSTLPASAADLLSSEGAASAAVRRSEARGGFGSLANDVMGGIARAGGDGLGGTALEVQPRSRRLFHGSGTPFDKPDPEVFDPHGLYGPGYYLTSEPRVAASYAAIRQGEIGLGEGANMRAVEVPEGVRLLDAEAKAPLELVEQTIDVLRRLDERRGAEGKPGQSHWGAFAEQWRSTTQTGSGLYDALEYALGFDKALVNKVLAGLGYDGIQYGGGRIRPILDSDGTPITHQAVAIFSDALPKIKNALTGAPGGIVDPNVMGNASRADLLADAIAGGLGAVGAQAGADEDTTIGERITRAVLGAETGLRTRGLLRGRMPFSQQTGIRFGARPQQTQQLAWPMSVPGQRSSTLYDQVAVVRMAGMLSGTATHLMNFASNVVAGTGTIAMKPAQVAFDAAVSAATGKERERYFAEWFPQMKGYAAGAFAGLQEVPGILKSGATQAALQKFDARKIDTGNKTADAVLEMPLRLLAASDAVFRGGSFGGHAAALATRQATREGLSGRARASRAEDILANISQYPRILDEANRLAARDVFQEEREFTKMLSQVREGKSRVFFDVFLPFVKTPYNVAAQGSGMTPAGYASAIKAAKDGQTGEAIDRAVRATAGTLGLYAGFQLAAGGYLTAGYPEEASERSTLPVGWKPYALRVPKDDGAVYVPVSMLGALSVPLGMAASLTDAYEKGVEDADLKKAAFRAIQGVGEYMLDLSALQGISAIGEMIRAPERKLEAFLENLTASAVPYSALSRQVQQAAGVAQRDPQGPHEAFLAAIPGLSGLIREKQTPLGDAKRLEPTGVMALVTGLRIGVEEDEPTLAVLRAARLSVPAPADEIDGIKLDDADKRALRERAGELIRRNLRGMSEARAARNPADVRKRRDEATRQAREEIAARLRRSGRRPIRSSTETRR